MPSKKYCTYSKQKKDTVKGLKDSLIELEHDITKMYQKLKSICCEIYFLYDAMPFSESSDESEESNDHEYIYEKSNYPKKKDVQSMRVK